MSERTGAARPPWHRRAAARLPALLREQPPFRRYWSAQTISMFGDQITSIALPLTGVLVLHARAAEMGYLTALVWLPSLLFAMPAGAWADRFGRRRQIMIATDAGRAALLSSVPACYLLHVLTLGQLYGVAFGAGTLSITFAVCDSPLFVAVVPEARYVEGNSLVYASRALSFVGGPSLGGLLVQALAAPFALAADALSFLGSALFLHRVKATEAPAAGGKGSVTAGARFVIGSPIVRASLAAVSVINFFTFGFSALFVLYATRSLHVRPGLLGLVLGAGAIGGLIGSLVTGRLARRIGIGWAYVLGCVIYPAPLALVPLAGGPLLLVAGLLFLAEFCSGFGVMILDISIGSIFAAVIPGELRARVSGAFQAVNYGTRPVGAVAGGLLGGLIGVRPTLWIAVIGAVTGFLWLLPSPLPRFRMPSDPAALADQEAPADQATPADQGAPEDQVTPADPTVSADRRATPGSLLPPE